ncbi:MULTISPECIES: MarR family winged helix-turn-helix transcriptional regulator [Legionella]|uniref:MarR family transcriptional regulator n=1 Tax=Legionella resiliens TaxID=2905958 RepID=A0ABS8WYV1_9GAMM|nr:MULTISPECIES: MarR family transcriptional regulator [unclassified Legionella]MCE0722514.1 MarR family transcriptional regulator [Legionella sp. 9fVS26]MCE3531668.1 MarR family transcriptional regulator [Legionella sp. 8cVS16]QLZ67690.1 MarR family transcriptional regulator [Legionella sp. PC1000]
MLKVKKRKEVSKLTDHIGYWMRLVSNEVSHAFARKLEQTGVTVAEWVVLRKMYDCNNIISPSKVAHITGLTRGAVSKLISRLLEKGLVNRKESAEDRRYQDIELTATAVVLIPKLADLADQNDEEFFSILTYAQREQFVKLLKKLVYSHQIKTAPIE